MKALVLESDSTLVYREIPLPDKKPGEEILVRVRRSGICGSDIPRGFHGKAYHYPLVMGHEFAGTVEEAPQNSAFRPGDRVAVFPLIPCGVCSACQIGAYAQCSDYDYYGSRRDGGFGEYVRVAEANLFPLPEHVDITSAAMTEPCAVALHGVEKLAVEAGMTGLVIGGGPIGNMAAQWLRLKGADPVYIADVDTHKLETAEAMGLFPIDSTKQNPVELLRSRHDGADCVIEACGLPATFVQAVTSAARFGQVVFMGNIHGTFTLKEADFSSILRNELTVRGTWNSSVTPRGRDEWTRVLNFIDRGIQVAPLISHRPPLKDGAEVFRRIVAAEEWYNKVVFEL